MNNRTRVAAIKDEEKFAALDQALAQSSFFETLERGWQASGKPKEGFSVVIKPNIMMAYSREDASTITDPELVEHLID